MSKQYWIWVGFNQNPKTLATYSTDEYKEHSINEKFKNIKSLDDVTEEIDDIIDSVTSCYVSVDKKTGEFYRDQQDCIIWKFDESNGQVYFDGIKKEKIYVAKSLAEFFSHVYDDCIEWHNINNYY